MNKITKEQYENAKQVNKMLVVTNDYHNDELIKYIDKMCGLRRQILENKRIIAHNEKEVIDRYEIYEQLKKEREIGENKEDN